MAKAKTEKAAEVKVKKTSARSAKTAKKTTVVAQTEEKPVDTSTAKKTAKKTAKQSQSLDSGLQAKSKQEIIEMFATKDGDTGSPEVQIALTTQKIYNLSQHLQENPKDNHSRRGLLKIIAKRRRILNYLQEKNDNRYNELTVKLGLKK